MWPARTAAIVVSEERSFLHADVSSGCSGLGCVCAGTKRPPEPITASCPRAKPRQLPLLGIEAHQRPHHRLLHQQLVRRITGIKLAALDPLRIALLAQGELALGFGNLLGT